MYEMQYPGCVLQPRGETDDFSQEVVIYEYVRFYYGQ